MLVLMLALSLSLSLSLSPKSFHELLLNVKLLQSCIRDKQYLIVSIVMSKCLNIRYRKS